MRLVLITAAAALALAAPATAATRTVVVKNIDFSVKTLRIKRGDSVRWLFRDGRTPHNVTSKGSPRFRSSSTRQGGSYTVRFTRRGTYRYVCTIHPNMRARVIVS